MTERGHTLLELVLSLGLFSLLGVILFSAFKSGNDLWRSVDSRTESLHKLGNVVRVLSADVSNTSANELSSKRVPVAGSGDAIWMLSSRDPAVSDRLKEPFKRDPNGKPEWQRNIIYYLVRASNHDALAGQSCAVDSNPLTDEICPHKMLVRKVIRGSTVPELLLGPTTVDTYLTQPAGLDVGAFSSEPGFEEARVLASNLLSFQAVGHAAGDRSITISLEAVALEEARRNIAIGTLPIQRFKTSYQVTLFPGVE